MRLRDTGIPESGISYTRAEDDTLGTRPAAGVADQMRIGDPVTHQGRRYLLLGLDPMGIPDRLADVEDIETGEVIRVPLSELIDD